MGGVSGGGGGESGKRNIGERKRHGEGKRKREYTVILIKSALERSRGLSRRTLSHESSHDNDTKCRPRDLGTLAGRWSFNHDSPGAQRALLLQQVPRPAPSGAVAQLRAPVSPPRHPRALRAASISIDTRSMLHFAPDHDSRQAALLDRLRFCATRPCARAARLLMSRDSSAEMMTGGSGEGIIRRRRVTREK